MYHVKIEKCFITAFSRKCFKNYVSNVNNITETFLEV